jgi:Tfp pilus assembly protein PilF
MALTLALSLVACGGHAKRKRMAEIKQDLGAALIGKQQYRQALVELRKAVDLDPQNARSHYHLAYVYLYGFKKPAEAEKALRKAISVSKEPYSGAHNLLGLALNDQGRYDEAIKEFEEALSNILYPTPQFAEQNLAQTLILQGKVDAGVRRLKNLLRRVPNLCGAYISLLKVGMEAGDSNMMAAYDPPFMKRCVRPKEIAKRIDPSALRGAYRRAVARCEQREDAECAFKLAKECTSRVPRTVGDSGPRCPPAKRPKPSAGFGGRK